MRLGGETPLRALPGALGMFAGQRHPQGYRQFGAAMAVVLLTGCAGLNGLLDSASMSSSGQAPVARGVDGGAASVLIVLCPRTPQAVLAASELLDRLISYGSEIVMARAGGSARLTINACPAPELMSQLATLPPVTVRKK